MKNEEIMKEEILKEIDLFYKSRETESTMFMGKEFHGIDGLLYRLRPDVQ